MDIFTIRQKLRTTRLSDISLRVTFYARVSTDSDEQLNSLDNQISYYRDYITRNPAWTFIDGFVNDEPPAVFSVSEDAAVAENNIVFYRLLVAEPDAAGQLAQLVLCDR